MIALRIFQIGIFYITFFVPLVTGPIAAYVFTRVIGQRRSNALRRFWLFLIATNLIFGLLIITNWGHAWPGSGFCAVIYTPVASIVAIVILGLRSKPYWRPIAQDVYWSRWYLSGLILIPVMQLLVAAVSPRFVDVVCPWLWFHLGSFSC
jgi:hypothetical protein